MRTIEIRVVSVVCGNCGFTTSARTDDSAKAAMVDHLMHSHPAGKSEAAA